MQQWRANPNSMASRLDASPFPNVIHPMHQIQNRCLRKIKSKQPIPLLASTNCHRRIFPLQRRLMRLSSKVLFLDPVHSLHFRARKNSLQPNHLLKVLLIKMVNLQILFSQSVQSQRKQRKQLVVNYPFAHVERIPKQGQNLKNGNWKTFLVEDLRRVTHQVH